MDNETRALVQQWTTAFCETPVLIDVELMRQVLADHDAGCAGGASAGSEITRLVAHA